MGRYRIVALVIAFVFSASAAGGQTVLTLDKSFIEKYRNRVTIDASFLVDQVHKSPNPAKKDGDLHIAGRSPDEIQLAVVSEIQNAKDNLQLVKMLNDIAGTTNNQVSVTGVWRIWPEHGGEHHHDQGQALDTFDTTNPPHVFEIHPVIKINDVDLIRTLRPIDGFDAKDAQRAFEAYERSSSEISATGQRVQITMRMVGYNYVHFLMRLAKKAVPAASDGEFVFAEMRDLDGELLVHNRRIAFVAKSTPHASLQTMTVGQCMELLGLPRLNLALVHWRVQNAKQRPEALRWGMPYEIVAVGLYREPAACENWER